MSEKNDDVHLEEFDIEIPKSNLEYSTSHLNYNNQFTPEKLFSIISDVAFEECVQEWCYGYLREKYNKIRRCGGRGDLGRDVICYKNYGVDYEKIEWVNYQCKYYSSPLTPSIIWVEIGKMIYYSFLGKYKMPIEYYFVSPNGVNNDLHDLLANSKKLKSELIKNWERNCEKKITAKQSIKLDEKLMHYIDTIDFSIFQELDPFEFIQQYRETPYFPFRFGGGLRKKRPEPIKPPSVINKEEQIYIQKLFDCYSDYKKDKLTSEADLLNDSRLHQHFIRQREYFYEAESLLRFERDAFPPDTLAFEDLKKQIYDCVIDLVHDDYDTAFNRLKTVTTEVKKYNLRRENPLSDLVGPGDKHGICHHLVNENNFEWVY